MSFEILYLNITPDTIVMKKKDYLPLHAGGSLIVGQEQDGIPFFDPVFDKKQGFSGLLTQVELWNTILTASEIGDLATCKIASLRPQNRVITWKSNAWQATKETDFKDIPIEKLCQKNLVLDQFIWPIAIDFDSFNNICRTIDGMFPSGLPFRSPLQVSPSGLPFRSPFKRHFTT